MRTIGLRVTGMLKAIGSAARQSGCGRRSGTALVTTVAITAALCLAVGTATYVGSQRLHMQGKLADRARAMAIAEAGANHAFTVLTTNFSLRTNAAAFPATAYGGGTYDVTVTPVGSNVASIGSAGTYGSVTESVVLDVRNVPVGTNDASRGWHADNIGILAGGDLTWLGDVIINMTNSWMHCNGSYYMNGVQTIQGNVSSCVQVDSVGGSTIQGDAVAPLYLRESPGNISGTVATTNLGTIEIPDIDLTPFYNRARAYNQVFTNSEKSISGTVTPAGGVMWVEGSLALGNGVYNGCFIATSNITMKTTGNGEIRQTKVGTYPAFISRDGTILIKQAKTFTFDGLIYCKRGSFDKQGNGDCIGTGQIVVAGNFSKNGGWSGMFYHDYLADAWPGYTNNAVANSLVPIAWQK